MTLLTKTAAPPFEADGHSSPRIQAVDALRGLIMILMSLDHANMLLSGGSSSEFWGGPLPQHETSLAFLTRFVTHLCAPGFFFLMGVGMVCFQRSRMQRGWTTKQIRHYFLRRGSLIVGVHFAMSLLFAFPTLMAGRFGIVFNVLYILGFSMIAAAWLMSVPVPRLAFLCAGSLLLPEFVLRDPNSFEAAVHPLMRLMAVPGFMGHHMVLYTFFPWFGLALLGIVWGRMMLKDQKKTFGHLPLMSVCAIGLFIFLRLLNGFGNLRPMQGAGWMAFLQLTKYPPSLTFMLLMMGVNFGLLSLLERVPSSMLKPSNPLLVFGRSALFFYVVHHFVYIAMMYAGLHSLSLTAMYPLWLLGVLIMYPLCRRYAKFRQQKSPASNWRLF